MSDIEQWRPARTGPWAAVDAGVLRNPKVARLRPVARLLYLACVLHAADELTDGHIAAHAVPRLLLEAGARNPDLRELEQVSLLKPDENGDGFHVHGYLEWNPPKAWWEHQRARNAAKVQAWRERQKDSSPQGNRPRNRLRTGYVPGERDETYKTLAGNGPNGSTPTGYRDPSSECPDCGERYGHGHAEHCPRMPAIVDPAA